MLKLFVTLSYNSTNDASDVLYKDLLFVPIKNMATIVNIILGKLDGTTHPFNIGTYGYNNM
jgi:hypothetical protein